MVDVDSDSKANIRNNARLFDARLKGLSESERLRLAQFVVTRCYLVAVATPDLDSAYRIFSVLNTRGLDLSATDILKAQIIGGVSKPQRDFYTKKWEDTEEDLGRDSTLLQEFREHVLKGTSPQQFIDDVLVKMASAYEELKDETYTSTENADQVNENLKWLNRLEFNDWMPAALAFSVRWRNQHDKMEVFSRIWSV